MNEKISLNTDWVIEALGKTFLSPSYAMLTQVRNGTGMSRNARTADAMFMSLWPSRGIYLAGIEVKVSILKNMNFRNENPELLPAANTSE